jgi:membrane associated rhomboid family serine protease
MPRLSLPPVTKYALILVIVCSTAVASLRYYTFFVLSQTDANNGVTTIHSVEEMSNGKAFPPPQKVHIPRLDEIQVPFLTLTAHGPLYPWTLVTSTLVELNVLPFLLSATTFLYGAKYCEHVWGSKELLRFLFLLAIVPNLLVYIIYVSMYWISYGSNPGDDEEWLRHFNEPVCGAAAIVCGFLVAFKQLVPEHMIVMFRGRIHVRVKRLPFIFVMVNTFLGILGRELYAMLTWAGFVTSWMYLRFYRITYADPLLPFSSNIGSTSTTDLSYEHNNSSGIKIRGDACDAFAFKNFFPEPLSFIADMVAERIFVALVVLRVCTPFTDPEIDAANTRAAARLLQGTMTPHQPRHRFDSQHPRGARAEAERRRSLALRALGQDASTGLTTPGRAVLPIQRSAAL